MQDLNDLYYYVQVVEHGGFTQAGRALGMPKSKLSRRIALLEARLGVRLIQRSTRRFSVTEIGQSYYARCKAMLVEAEAAQTVIDATHEEPCGTVHLSCPVALLNSHVGGMLISFALRYPRVTVDLAAINRAVDVVAEGFDVALRVRPAPLEDSDLVLRVLARAGQCLVASPALIERLGAPSVPAELSSWPSLGYGPVTRRHAWSLLSEDGSQADLPHTPRFVTTDMITLRAAAIAGIGVVQLPTMMVSEQLTDGRLARLLPRWPPRPEIVHALFPSRRGLLSSVRALVDHLAEEFTKVGDV